jgi:3-methyladenine DNA glycosylase/8-oxoguanine DNA glycosylase
MEIFQYSDEQLNALKKKDLRMRILIEKVGRIERERIPDLFVCLVQSIISQQISSVAAATIYRRLQKKAKSITPKNIGDLGVTGLASEGVSSRKASFILGIVSRIENGQFSPEKMSILPDEIVIEEMIKLPGVGVWTAEMVMIFSMNRMNILSGKDLGIQRGLKLLYGIDRMNDDIIADFRQKFSPLCSVASLYLWTVCEKTIPG